MPTTTPGHFLVAIIAVGLLNYIATIIIVHNMIFEDLRVAVRSFGSWVTARPAWAQIYKLSQWLGRRRHLYRLAGPLHDLSYTRKDRPSRIGPKLHYFIGCPMCVGVWVGFIQAAFFGGPLKIELPWNLFGIGVLTLLLNIVANGLLYKAAGHTFLQLGAIFHNTGEQFKAEARYFRILNGDEKLGEYLAPASQPATDPPVDTSPHPVGDKENGLNGDARPALVTTSR